jgi:4-hydroxy-tetrahydrodipicolinate synthase
MEWILDEVDGSVPVYAGTGHYSTNATIELSRHAMEHGATGLMIMPPYLLRPPKQDVLDHFRRIREATSAHHDLQRPSPVRCGSLPTGYCTTRRGRRD